MPTLPNTSGGIDLLNFSMVSQPGYTHKLLLDRNRVTGMTDGREALVQAIYLILSVERYAYPIYSRAYGAELADLVGKPKGYAMSEIKRRITEALIQDDRITAVDGWRFEQRHKSLVATFTVRTIYGDIEITKEVEL